MNQSEKRTRIPSGVRSFCIVKLTLTATSATLQSFVLMLSPGDRWKLLSWTRGRPSRKRTPI